MYHREMGKEEAPILDLTDRIVPFQEDKPGKNEAKFGGVKNGKNARINRPLVTGGTVLEPAGGLGGTVKPDLIQLFSLARPAPSGVRRMFLVQKNIVNCKF
mgnify:CR=1 FL=1